MDTKNFFEKAIVSAELLANRTGVVATRAADAAGKTATSFVSATKLNMQIFDLNTEIEILYKEIGKMVYHVHTGMEEDQDALQAKLLLIDEKLEKIEEMHTFLQHSNKFHLVMETWRPKEKEYHRSKKARTQY